MKNRWSAEARAASAAARLEKYGPMMGLRPWGDTARSAAAASRAARAAQAGGMTASEATEFALDARFGTGYLSDGSGGIDVTLGIGRERSSGSYSGGRRIPVMSDATPFEDRKAKYEAAFREWWKGVQATEQNIAAFHAFVAAFGGAAAGSMGAYRQATGEQPVAGMSRLIGKGRGYRDLPTPIASEWLHVPASEVNLVKDSRGCLPNGTAVKYVEGGCGGGSKAPFRDHLDYLDKQITLLGTGGLLTMLTESGSGTLAGGAHQQAFDQVAKGDAVLISEALQRDFDKPLLDQYFPGWPVEAGFELETAETVAVGGSTVLTTGSIGEQ